MCTSPAVPQHASVAQADRQDVLDFALKLMLYAPPRQSGPSNPLQAARPGLVPRMGLTSLNPQLPGAPGNPTGLPMPAAAGLQGPDGGDEDMEDESGMGTAAADAAASLGLDVPAVGPVAPGLSSDDMETVTNVCAFEHVFNCL